MRLEDCLIALHPILGAMFLQWKQGDGYPYLREEETNEEDYARGGTGRRRKPVVQRSLPRRRPRPMPKAPNARRRSAESLTPHLPPPCQRGILDRPFNNRSTSSKSVPVEHTALKRIASWPMQAQHHYDPHPPEPSRWETATHRASRSLVRKNIISDRKQVTCLPVRPSPR